MIGHIEIKVYRGDRVVCLRGLFFEIFCQRGPVVVVPAGAEVGIASRGEAAVAEDEGGCRTGRLELEANERIEAGGPVGGAVVRARSGRLRQYSRRWWMCWSGVCRVQETRPG